MRLTAKLVTVGSVVGARNGAWLTCTPSLVFHWLPSILKPSSLTKSSSLHPRVRPKDPRLCPLRGPFPLGWRQPWSFPLSYQRRGGCRVLVPSGLRHSGERVLRCQRPGGSRLPSPAPLAGGRVGTSPRPPDRARGWKLPENGIPSEESGPSGTLDPGGVLALNPDQSWGAELLRGQENREAPWS